MPQDWNRIDALSWAGLVCNDCRQPLTVPYYSRANWKSLIRLCQRCHQSIMAARQRKLSQLTLPLPDDSPSIRMAKLSPPYADVQPIPADVVIDPGEVCPFEVQ